MFTYSAFNDRSRNTMQPAYTGDEVLILSEFMNAQH